MMKFLYILFIHIFLFFHGQAQAMMSVEDERELGKKLLKMVDEQVVIVKDPEVSAYINEIGRKILDKLDGRYFDYHFYVIQDEAFNAFAMPGGYIFVHSGLLEAMETESELACVLAHEIGHVQGRHIARRMDRMQKVTIASAALAIAGLFLGSGKAGSAGLATTSALSMSMGLKYSREDEEEADRRAYQWICSSGYDPSGLVTVMKKIQQHRWLGTDLIPSYLSTHPSSGQRMTYLEYLLEREPCAIKVKNNDRVLKRVQVKILINAKDPKKIAEKFRKKFSENPGDIYALYGLAHALLAAMEYEESINTFKLLTNKAPEIHEFQVDLGMAFFDSGRHKEALTIFKKYCGSHKNNMQAEFYLGRSYLETGKPDKALPLFLALKDNWPDPGALFLNLGRSYASIGKEGESHYYLYLHYLDVGDKDAASYHKRQALRLLPPESDLYQEILRKDSKKDSKKDS